MGRLHIVSGLFIWFHFFFFQSKAYYKIFVIFTFTLFEYSDALTKPILFFTLLSLTLFSCNEKKEKVSEGIITFGIDYPENKDNFFLYHVLPKEMKASFKNDFMELKIKKATMENTIVVDGKEKDICAYYDYGEIYSTNLTDNDKIVLLEKQPNYKIELTGEKDTLIGFDVLKANVINPDDPNIKFEVWYTKDIHFKNPNWFNGFDKIPGVMLKYKVIQYGMKMEFVAKKFEHVTVNDSLVTLRRPGKNVSHSEFDAKIVDLFESFK